MSLEQLIFECKAWQMQRISGAKGPGFWEQRRSLIAEIYGQLSELRIDKYEALYAYNYVRVQ